MSSEVEVLQCLQLSPVLVPGRRYYLMMGGCSPAVGTGEGLALMQSDCPVMPYVAILRCRQCRQTGGSSCWSQSLQRGQLCELRPSCGSGWLYQGSFLIIPSFQALEHKELCTEGGGWAEKGKKVKQRIPECSALGSSPLEAVSSSDTHCPTTKFC